MVSGVRWRGRNKKERGDGQEQKGRETVTAWGNRVNDPILLIERLGRGGVSGGWSARRSLLFYLRCEGDYKKYSWSRK